MNREKNKKKHDKKPEKKLKKLRKIYDVFPPIVIFVNIWEAIISYIYLPFV